MGGNHTTAHLEDWAQGTSWLHQRDGRAKILAALAMLISLSLTPTAGSGVVALVAWLLVIATGTSGLPMLGIVARAAAVLPFALTFALVTWIAGESAHALALLAKSFLSAWTAVLLMATTPVGELLNSFQQLGVPRLVTEVILMMVRYLRVLADRAASMRRAAASRGASMSSTGRWSTNLLPWGTEAQRQAGAGMVASLFGEAVERAGRIHGAMLSRGYRGRFPLTRTPIWRAADSILVFAAVAGLGAVILAGRA